MPSASQFCCFVHIFASKCSKSFQQYKVLSFSKCFLLIKNCQVLHDRCFRQQCILTRTLKLFLEGRNCGLFFQIVRDLDA